MPAPYSNDLREKVIEAYENREGQVPTLARRFKVSTDFIRDLIERYIETGDILPKPHNGGCLPEIRGPKEKYLRSLKAEPDLLLEEIQDRYYRAWGVFLSVSALCKRLQRLGLPRKKKQLYDPEKKTQRVRRLTAEYHDNIQGVKAENLIFLDEVGAVLNMVLPYGRAPSHERVYGDRPVAKGCRISTVGAMSLSGLETAMCFEGTLNASVFLHFIKNFLVPVLKPWHVVIMDNASPHKNAEMAELISKTGASSVYLPPYSPELNPIENAWSKLKQYLRKAKARTKEALYDAITRGLELITNSDAEGWFRHAGYMGNQVQNCYK